MTEAEIMKALVVHFDEDKPCDECPYWNIDEPPCHISLQKDVQSAIDLINRKNAENEDLKIKNEHLAVFLAESEAKVEKLIIENLQMIASIKGLKAEAIKEFTQRVRKYLLFTKCVNDEDINEIWRYLDQIAKEMGLEL